MNTSDLTSPESSVDNSNDVTPFTLAVNENENLNAPLAASDVYVNKERATSVLPVLDNVPDSPGVNVNGAFEEPTKAQVGKKTARRSKERVKFVTDPQARSSALYKRKSTLFSKGLKLHAMTNAEVLIIIDHKGQRFVGGSQAILDMYNSGLIKPTRTDQKYVGNAVSTSTETTSNGVQPLENTPENLRLDHRLANVLGHSSSSQAPPSRRRLPYSDSSSGEIPRPVQDLLLNRPKPQLSDSERNDVPPIQRQSKICFIPDKDVDFVVSNQCEKEASN